MQVAIAKQVATIAYREASLRLAQRTAAAGMLVGVGLACAVQSWALAVVALAASVGMVFLVTRDAIRRITRRTGLSPAEQAAIWKRYRSDVTYGVDARVALANDGLARALAVIRVERAAVRAAARETRIQERRERRRRIRAQKLLELGTPPAAMHCS